MTVTTTPAMTTAVAMTAETSRRVERARRALRGIRARVVLGSVVLLVLALGVSVIATRQMLEVRADEETERELAQEIEELRALSAGTSPQTGEPFGDDVAAIFTTFLSRNVPAADEAFYAFVRGEPYLFSFDAPVELLEDAELVERWTSSRTATRVDSATPSGDARTLAVPLLGGDGEVLGTFVVAIFPAADRAEVDRVVRTLLLVAGMVLVFGCVAAWTIAGRVLRPVGELTRATRSISANDLTTRIPVEGNDELAELGHTFNGMLDRLDESFRGQRAFLDDVAHELRTPITIVRGHLEVLGDDPAERAETIALVIDELDRMARYVGDLLVVARASRPDFLRLDLVDLSDLLDSALARASALAPREWARASPLRTGDVLLLADGDRLLQAVLALVTNAVQHTSEGDRIEIGGETIGGDVRLWVSDPGPGIDPSDHQRIFDRFSRGERSTRSRPEGTGLGLPIVAAIARAHGGHVELDSAVGAGATFRIVIPRSHEPEDLP
ncbi:MAG: sensor histidine kinase [Acidimicrobiia bacterium]